MNIFPNRITPAHLMLADIGETPLPTAADHQFHNFKLLKTGINIAPLCEAIAKQHGLWKQITKRQETDGSPHKYTDSIFIRWSEDQSVEAAFKNGKNILYPAFWALPEVKTLVDDVLETVGATELGRIMIVSLDQEGFIEPHSDEGEYADHFERFHISLQSDEGNMFSTETYPGCGEYVHMRPGELWYFNHKAVHFLYNGSERPRIHLIVDCVAPKFKKRRV